MHSIYSNIITFPGIAVWHVNGHGHTNQSTTRRPATQCTTHQPQRSFLSLFTPQPLSTGALFFLRLQVDLRRAAPETAPSAPAAASTTAQSRHTRPVSTSATHPTATRRSAACWSASLLSASPLAVGQSSWYTIPSVPHSLSIVILDCTKRCSVPWKPFTCVSTSASTAPDKSTATVAPVLTDTGVRTFLHVTGTQIKPSEQVSRMNGKRCYSCVLYTYTTTLSVVPSYE